MTELNFYQKVLVDLKLVGNEEAEGVFRYISNTYPEVTEDSCEKLIGMLALLFPDLDYGGLMERMFSDDSDKPLLKDKISRFIKRLFLIKE